MKNKKNILLILILLVVLSSLAFFSFTKSAELSTLDNDVEVELNSELIYYLNVTYDGVDRDSYDSRISSEGVTSKLFSGYIYVEDKLPEGLTFEKFITGEDGTIGAVNQTTGQVCRGYVIDEVEQGKPYTVNTNGLFYDENTRTVSFRVKELQAGCELTVGIVTKTPASVENRMDFYNFATAREQNLLKKSNTVHAFIGASDNLKTVTYEYEGTVPNNAPELPVESSYAPNASVGLALEPYMEGYVFSGWKVKTESGTVVPATTTSFIMPNENVKVVGSFEALTPHKVTYKITGIPESIYTPPEEKTYYKDQIVSLDTTKVGEIINGYKFLGWTYSGITVDDNNEFIMPDNDVIITGEFEEVKYKVIYKFYDTGNPPNSNSLLPDTKEYKPGETVTLEWVKDEPVGYQFSGWYKDDKFTMPDSDVIIYGEWQIKRETFTPSIIKEIIDRKDKYNKGETVNFKITVSNPESFAINNVQVKENNSNARFIEGDNYTLRTEHIVSVPTIEANSSVIIYAEYPITDESGIVTNEVEIIGASISNNHELNNEVEYKASVSFEVADTKLKICKIVENNSDDNNVYQFHIVSTDDEFDSWINLSSDGCHTIYVDSKEYQITEVLPQSYELTNITYSGNLTGTRNGNTSIFMIGNDPNYEITFNNKYLKKGYYRSSGRVENIILREETPEELVGYTVNYYYDGVKINVQNGIDKVGESIFYDADNSVNHEGHHYILDHIDGENKKISLNSSENIVDIYYERDELVDLSILSDMNIGDGIPDKYQVTVNYLAINATFSSGSTTYSAIVTKYDENGILSEKGEAVLSGAHIPTATAAAGYGNLSWSPSAPIVNLVISEEITFTITAVPIAPEIPTPPTPSPDTDIPDLEIPLSNPSKSNASLADILMPIRKRDESYAKY